MTQRCVVICADEEGNTIDTFTSMRMGGFFKPNHRQGIEHFQSVMDEAYEKGFNIMMRPLAFELRVFDEDDSRIL